MNATISETEMDQAIQSLSSIVSFPSFGTEATDHAPFGEHDLDALKAMLHICETLGFTTYLDPDGYYGYADIGTGDKLLGVICHMDVVPAGNLSDWQTDPFKLTIKDGVLYGRGVQDDKGPTIAALYALKHAMDAGLKLRHQIRFIFETDEETLWRGINKYVKEQRTVDFGIAPDADFPVTYAEKALLQARIIGPGSEDLNIDLQNPFNAVPGAAEYSGPKQGEVKAALQKLNFTFTENDQSITVAGQSVHSMEAPKGTNAVVRLAMALSQVFDAPMLQFIDKGLGQDAYAANVLGDISDTVSGRLTFNLASLTVNKQTSSADIDLRIPVTVDKQAVVDKLSSTLAKFGLTYQQFDYLNPQYVKTDSPLVKTLMAAYQQVTGDKNAEPLVTGGATLARVMPNCVAFGGMLPSVKSYMHQVNEQWQIADMKTTMQIYVAAFTALNSIE